MSVANLSRKLGVSDASIYKLKTKFGGMDVSGARHLRTLEGESGKLKQMLADAMLDNVSLKDLRGRNGDDRRRAESNRASRRTSRVRAFSV